MASQFTIYSSNDLQGPGYLTGTTGSLIQVLDACLVNGYGTKPAAGWIKPLSNISASCIGCYQQGAGSQFTLFINDNNPLNGTSNTYNEAWATGWMNLISLSAVTSSTNVGLGSGQFPLPSQAMTQGKTIWRKSATNNTTPRSWIIAADASTMYIWIADGGGNYYHGGFGDFFSLYGASDKARCFIFGKGGEQTATITNIEQTDCISDGNTFDNNNTNQLANAFPGHYIASSPSMSTPPINYSKKGDYSVSSGAVGSIFYYCPMNGILSSPNPTDNNFYLSPIWVVIPSSTALRGRYRGIYQMCHPLSNFTNGQVINGTGTFSGKTFMIISGGYTGGGWVVEISPTVETN